MNPRDLAAQLVVALEAERADLVTQRDQLDAQIEAVDGRLDLARQLVGDEAPPAPAARQVACPDCGLMLANRHAVDSHRREAHPRSAAKPVETPKVPGAKTVAERTREMRARVRAGEPRRTRSETVRELAAQRATCPECGREFSAVGLGAHRARRHPEAFAHRSTSTPATPATPAVERLPENTGPLAWDLPPARRHGDLDPDVVYRCGDCGDESATTESLSNHTFSQHGRPPRMTEKVTVRPKGAAA